jgi:hypothetical protein
MLSDKDMYARMASGWRAGRPETVCGNGSTLASTATIREWLPWIIDEYDIRRLNDAGAGDLYWIRKVRWPQPIAYRAFDLIPRDESVTMIDITTAALPPSDAVLCRMVLNHLDDDRITRAIYLFRQTTTYLLATQFDGDKLPKRSPQFTRLDLRRWLGDPIERCQDGREPECSLALWRL